MVESTGQRRFRLSIRTLMIAVALCAVLLALALLTVRHFEARVRLERLLADQARNQAQQARYLLQVRSAQAAVVAAKLGTTDQPKAGSLWAALSASHAIFKAGRTKDLRIEFTLVNDGDKEIDPKIGDSRIVVNGKECSDSGLIFSSVQNGDRFKALSPEDSLQFSFPLADQFKEPGTYRISWNGAGFQSPEIVFRILPEEAR
jgi:hypothetical protein